MEVALLIESKIYKSSIKEVENVTPSIVKNAITHIKDDKSDPAYEFSSDCLKHAPDSLYIHLSNVFKLFLIHGHVRL